MERPEGVWADLSEVSLEKEGHFDDHMDSSIPTEEIVSKPASDSIFSTTNAEDVCPQCLHPVTDAEPAIKCDSCHTWNHIECEDMSPEEYSHLMKDEYADIPWYCGNCLMFGIAEKTKALLLQPKGKLAVQSNTSKTTRTVQELAPSIPLQTSRGAHHKATSTLNSDGVGDFRSTGMANAISIHCWNVRSGASKSEQTNY